MWDFFRLSDKFWDCATLSWHSMYNSAIAKDFAKLRMSSTMMFVFVSSSILTPNERARSFHVLSRSWINAINVGGLLTGPKGMTLYVHFVASGPAKASL